ncbi:uncharacterized protein [Ptychodera flava]|uniref:uncharacterized protein n=1 Tax=Ptychodera flava TaxID=63121 RepID=UPI00396A5271
MSISPVSVVVVLILLSTGTNNLAQHMSDTTNRVCSYSLTSPSDVDGRCPHLKQAVGCRERTDVADGDSSLREEIEALKTSLQALRDEFEERKRQCLCDTSDTDEDEDASPPEAFHVHSSEGRRRTS